MYRSSTANRSAGISIDAPHSSAVNRRTGCNTGSGSPVATEIRDRMEMVVEVSTEHSDYFSKNLVAIRAEKRLALVVYRPASFITGTFTTSP